MYSYKWDGATGGLLLDSTPLGFSREPRPVYYQELDILGFDKHWNYEKNDAFPYMWAEANSYWYRGRKVAQTRGGSLYTAPELVLLEDPEPEGKALRFVEIDAMVEKNRELMEQLTQDTIVKVFKTYTNYRNKVDLFHVSYSGGKDSEVTLDIVQRAIPSNSFVVVFGDTGMEFPDTYAAVNYARNRCKRMGIEFFISQSHISPSDSWQLFGSPSKTLRWCCSVHKTTPQLLKLKEILKKTDLRELAFVGVRADESYMRRHDKKGVKVMQGESCCRTIGRAAARQIDTNSAYLVVCEAEEENEELASNHAEVVSRPDRRKEASPERGCLARKRKKRER